MKISSGISGADYRLIVYDGRTPRELRMYDPNGVSGRGTPAVGTRLKRETGNDNCRQSYLR